MTSDALPTALSGELPSGVRRLHRRLREAGFRAWVVGGSVRDSLRSALSGQRRAAAQNDWDIATDARPEQVMKLFPQVVPVGIQHGTVLVVLDGVGYEVTTLRGETTYSDGRRPDVVRFVDDITLDLARRDFTVNAIAFDPETEQLIDPFGGVRDLEARVLRAVGVPAERFAEDGLRVLRAARFVATLEFSLDAETERAISPSLDTYRKVSAERIRDEWVKAMKARQPSRAFEVMRQHGLLAVTAPELLESVGCAQNRHHAYDVWEHTMRCVDASPAASPVVRVAALLHDIAKPRMRRFDEASQDYTFHEHERIGADMAATLAERLRFSNEERERIVALVRHHLIFYEPSWSDRAVRRWLRRVTPELLGDLLQLGRADILGKGREPAADFARLEALERHVDKVLAEGTPLSLRDLAIGGRDLMEIGLEPGPAFGRILRTLLDEVIDEPSRNQRDILLARARQIAEEP